MTFYAQAGQDAWVHGIIGDSGFFVDVGAHDGIEHSNTYALEQLGWTGICVEPDPFAFDRLRSARTCDVSSIAICAEKGTTTIQPSGLTVPCWPLRDLLDDAAPTPIDYLSIDVEGQELDVLAGMDWGRWPVRLITVEHNLYLTGPAHKQAINAVLTGVGFVRVVEDVVAEGYGPYEDWYANPALVDVP
jgi:FkbM family methyltransferase